MRLFCGTEGIFDFRTNIYNQFISIRNSWVIICGNIVKVPRHFVVKAHALVVAARKSRWTILR